MKTVADLRRDGYKVKVCHRRLYVTNEFYFKSYLMSKFDVDTFKSEKGNNSLLGPDSHCGMTTVEITTPNGAVTVRGEAECSSKDNFNRKLGLKKALGRALSQL